LYLGYRHNLRGRLEAECERRRDRQSKQVSKMNREEETIRGGEDRAREADCEWGR